MRAPLAALISLAAGGRAFASDVESRAILDARDEVFSRPEYELPDEDGLQIMSAIGRFVDYLAWAADTYPVAYYIVMALLVATLIILVAHIIWTLRVARRATFEDEFGEADLHLARVEPGDFRKRAVAHAREGRFEAAVRDLWTALVLGLDRRGAVSYARHKALLDYRFEARDDEVRGALDLFAGGYLPTSFGRRPLAEARFEEMLAAVDKVTAK